MTAKHQQCCTMSTLFCTFVSIWSNLVSVLCPCFCSLLCFSSPNLSRLSVLIRLKQNQLWKKLQERDLWLEKLQHLRGIVSRLQAVIKNDSQPATLISPRFNFTLISTYKVCTGKNVSTASFCTCKDFSLNCFWMFADYLLWNETIDSNLEFKFALTLTEGGKEQQKTQGQKQKRTKRLYICLSISFVLTHSRKKILLRHKNMWTPLTCRALEHLATKIWLSFVSALLQSHNNVLYYRGLDEKCGKADLKNKTFAKKQFLKTVNNQ